MKKATGNDQICLDTLYNLVSNHGYIACAVDREANNRVYARNGLEIHLMERSVVDDYGTLRLTNSHRNEASLKAWKDSHLVLEARKCIGGVRKVVSASGENISLIGPDPEWHVALLDEGETLLSIIREYKELEESTSQRIS